MDLFHDSPDQDCPSDTELLRIIFQGKWRLRVLREIAKGPVRLSQLRRAVPECSKKVLIDTLHGLEGLGWIERQEFSTRLRKVSYSLTSKCEQDVRRAIAIALRETVETTELRDVVDRLSAALPDTDEEEIIAEFKHVRRKGKPPPR